MQISENKKNYFSEKVLCSHIDSSLNINNLCIFDIFTSYI